MCWLFATQVRSAKGVKVNASRRRGVAKQGEGNPPKKVSGVASPDRPQFSVIGALPTRNSSAQPRAP